VANPNWSVGRNLENLPKMLTFWAAILQKMKNYPKYRKITDFRSEFGPQVGHPCSKSWDTGHKYINKLKIMKAIVKIPKLLLDLLNAQTRLVYLTLV
jgi:hypothetical protein